MPPGDLTPEEMLALGIKPSPADDLSAEELQVLGIDPPAPAEGPKGPKEVDDPVTTAGTEALDMYTAGVYPHAWGGLHNLYDKVQQAVGPGMISDGIQAMQDHETGGHADELEGAGYAGYRDYQRARMAEGREANPKANIVGKGIGLAGLAATGGGAGFARGAAEGGAYGTVRGLADSDGDIKEGLKSGAVGAATGGTFGAIAAKAAKLRAARRAAQKAEQQAATEAAKRAKQEELRKVLSGGGHGSRVIREEADDSLEGLLRASLQQGSKGTAEGASKQGLKEVAEDALKNALTGNGEGLNKLIGGASRTGVGGATGYGAGKAAEVAGLAPEGTANKWAGVGATVGAAGPKGLKIARKAGEKTGGEVIQAAGRAASAGTSSAVATPLETAAKATGAQDILMRLAQQKLNQERQAAKGGQLDTIRRAYVGGGMSAELKGALGKAIEAGDTKDLSVSLKDAQQDPRLAREIEKLQEKTQ